MFSITRSSLEVLHSLKVEKYHPTKACFFLHTRCSIQPPTMSSSQATIVFFASVAGAAAFTAIGSSIHGRFFPPEVKETVHSEWSQAQYMREVRLRYAEAMANSNGYGRRWYVALSTLLLD